MPMSDFQDPITLPQSVIPDFHTYTARIERIATSGYFLGLGIRDARAEFMLNRYPAEWRMQYDREALLYGDPAATWVVSQTRSVRWSEMNLPDPRNVMRRAAAHGMRFGATLVAHAERRRSFLSVARPDRELTDPEMDELQGLLQQMADLHNQAANRLTAGELAALAALRDGATQASAARNLGISLSTLKNRLDSAQRKLGGVNTLNTVVIAVRRGLI